MEYTITHGKTESPDHRLLRIFPALPDYTLDNLHQINAPQKLPSIKGLRGVVYIAQVDKPRFTEVGIWISRRLEPDNIALSAAKKIKELMGVPTFWEKGFLKEKEEGAEVRINIQTQDWTDRTPGKLIISEEEQTSTLLLLA
jgi:hypothetical protein